jgi:manganese efflux pump family protein
VDVAALVTWILTAGGGSVLLTTWLTRRRTSGSSRLPAPLILGHAGLAVVGLVLWIVYLANDSDALARVTFVVVLVVALLGFTMLGRWLSGGGPRHVAADTRPENNFPLPVVAAHGLFAAATLVLVLLAAFVV